jgi:hypothetical protein
LVSNEKGGKGDNMPTIIDSKGTTYLGRGKSLIVMPRNSEETKKIYFSAEIIYLYSDKYNNMWVGTRKGGYYYKNGDLTAKPIYFLKDISIASIILDRENTIWICSPQKGIYKSINKGLLNIDLINDEVCNFYKNKDELSVALTSQIITINQHDSLTYSTNQKLFKQNELLYFFKNNFANYYSTRSGLFSKEKNQAILTSDGTSEIFPREIISIGKDSILISSTADLYFIKQNKTYKKLKPPFIVISILQLKNKKILLGSRSNEGIVELKDDTFIPYLNQYSQLRTRINDLKEDDKGNIWIATNEKGLFCYSNNKLYEFTQKNGLSSNKVNELEIDSDGNIWIATNVGLSKINIITGLEKATINSFNNSHGLPNLEIKHIAFFNHKIWCSAQNNVFYFDIHDMYLNKVAPYSYIQSITINDSLFNTSTSPILNYNENNITFEFTGITHKNPDNKKFLYQLKGYDKEWKSSTLGQIQYANLSHGDYTFKVYALNNDGVKSLLPATFDFTILKPFWFTWWFITGEIILVIIIGYSIIAWRIDKIKKQEEEKTRINQKLAEFQMTAVRAQMNPHFIFNAISSIQHYILKADVYQSYNYLAKFSKLVRNVLDNSKEEYITISDEIHSLNLYMELEKVRFKEPFETIVTIDPTIETESTIVPTMIIQPYIENAIWHGLMPKQYDGKLSLTFEKADEELVIIVTDNGLGIETSKKHKRNKKHVSKGMSLIKLRLEALQRKHNKPFSIVINDLEKKSLGTLAGTEVIIRIPLLID